MGGENGRGEKGRGNCSLDVIYERIILIIKNPVYMF